MANRFSNSVQTLEDRIRAIQVEIDSVIEARVAQVMAACPNVPEESCATFSTVAPATADAARISDS